MATVQERQRDETPTDPARADDEARGTDKRTTWFATVKRTVTEFQDDGLTDWAAALTYYGLLALFPALIAFVGIIGLVADPAGATRTITEIVTQIGPSSAADTFSGPIQSITSNSGTSGILAVAGFLLALWGASGYVGAFIRASNIIYETPEGRPFWKLRPLQLAITLVTLILAAITLLALIVSGPLASAVGSAIGLSDAAVTAYQIAKWPILALLVITIFSILYYASPNAKLRGFKWVTFGSVVALVIWVIVSAAFALYVANFGSYDKTYGTLGGVVVLLVWMWLTNIAILLGHELNAERERSAQLAEGVPEAEHELQLEPRDEPDDQRTT
ncbi:MAG: YihY/virulence factor BrkB family protein [Solirubrobacterales bacterium]